MINSKFYYLLSLIFVFVIPAVVAAYFVIQRISIISLLIFVVGITVVGSIWDIWATRHGSKDPVWLWQFNFKDTLGIKIFDLPIEEYLFYISACLYVVFIWEGVKYAVELKSAFLLALMVGLLAWSLLSVLVPYLFGVKGDKLK